MNRFEVLHLDVCPESYLEKAIAEWLNARREYKKQASNASEYNYNATYFGLGEAWAELCAESADTSGAFESFRRGLILPEDEELPPSRGWNRP